jgi:hypothetical protein
VDRVVVEEQRRKNRFLGLEVIGRNPMVVRRVRLKVGTQLISRIPGLRHAAPTSVGDYRFIVQQPSRRAGWEIVMPMRAALSSRR